jgi:hypothetical protein
VHDFINAWNKVMNLDRFDLTSRGRAGHPRGAATH